MTAIPVLVRTCRCYRLLLMKIMMISIVAIMLLLAWMMLLTIILLLTLVLPLSLQLLAASTGCFSHPQASRDEDAIQVNWRGIEAYSRFAILVFYKARCFCKLMSYRASQAPQTTILKTPKPRFTCNHVNG